ncbi:MAG: hypothetical protein PHU05_06460 [Bacilli bacterium]|nr:hypothetical protein [Bacilli bacterium]
MSINKYLESNNEKIKETELKNGKIKLNKKIIKGCATVLVATSFILSLSGCGQNEKLNPDTNTNKGQYQQQIDLSSSETPYYDTLDENLLYFKKYKDVKPVEEAAESILYTDNIEITEKGKNILKEVLAKYIYKETTVRQLYLTVDSVIKNESTYTGDTSNLYNEVNHWIVSYLAGAPYTKTYIDEDDQIIAHSDKYSLKKYGETLLTQEQMNVDINSIATEEEINEVIKYKNSNVTYEQIVKELFEEFTAKHYMELCETTAFQGYILDAFTTEDEITYSLILDPNIKVSSEVLIPALREWGTRINEMVLTSKIKYGEYTKEGLVQIEKPKVLQK